MTSPFMNCPITNQETTTHPRKTCSLVLHRVANMKRFSESENFGGWFFRPFHTKQESEVILQHPRVLAHKLSLRFCSQVFYCIWHTAPYVGSHRGSKKAEILVQDHRTLYQGASKIDCFKICTPVFQTKGIFRTSRKCGVEKVFIHSSNKKRLSTHLCAKTPT